MFDLGSSRVCLCTYVFILIALLLCRENKPWPARSLKASRTEQKWLQTAMPISSLSTRIASRKETSSAAEIHAWTDYDLPFPRTLPR